VQAQQGAQSGLVQGDLIAQALAHRQAEPAAACRVGLGGGQVVGCESAGDVEHVHGDPAGVAAGGDPAGLAAVVE
jgi:hypothetical protein